MGYTHYFSLTNATKEDRAGYLKALPSLLDIVTRYRDMLCYECNDTERGPMVSEEMVRFNGKGEAGHETFRFALSDRAVSLSEFCKTARKPYDIAVCECLLVLNALIPSLEVHSDGFSGTLADQEENPHLDGCWDEAIENVKQYGIKHRVEIVNRRVPYCDLRPVLED
jgi:hypothetical protein